MCVRGKPLNFELGGLNFEFYPYLFINFTVPHFNLFGLPSFRRGRGRLFGEAPTPPLPQLSPTHSLVVVVADRLVYQVV